MKAKEIFAKKERLADGAIVEMVIWQLPQADMERPHGLKYRLYYGKDGKRLVGYDNERGKGDHRHIGDQEFPYVFVSERQLIADFLADIKKMRGE
jgi:hypothetical protein